MTRRGKGKDTSLKSGGGFINILSPGGYKDML